MEHKNSSEYKKHSDLASIIIYASQDLDMLSQSLEACLNQQYSHLEIIVADDADGISDKLAPALKADSRVKIIKFPHQHGLAKCLNEAFVSATGNYLSWIPENCLLEPKATSELIQHIKEHKNVSFVFSDYHVYNPETKERKLEIISSNLKFNHHSRTWPVFIYTREVADTMGNYREAFEMLAGHEFFIRSSRTFLIAKHPAMLGTLVKKQNRESFEIKSYSTLYKTILFYLYDYARKENLKHVIYSFPFWVRQFTPGLRSCLLKILKQTIKVYKISFRFGAYFQFLMFYLMVKNKIDRVLSFIVIPLKRNLMHIRISRLRKYPTETNCLCLVSKVVVGGSEKVLWDVVAGTRRKGFRFHLLSTKGENNRWTQKFVKGFDSRIILNKKLNFEYTESDEIFYAYFKYMVKHLNIKIVLISNAFTGYRFAEKIKSDFPDIKLLDFIHVEEYCGATADIHFAVPYIDQRICISKRLKNIVTYLYKAHNIPLEYTQRIKVIYNGNDMESFKKSNVGTGDFRAKHHIGKEKKIITYIGRFSSEKRPFLFIDIAHAIERLQLGTDICWVMAGDGTGIDEIKNKIKYFGLQDQFILPGMLDVEGIKSLLADSTIMLIVSEVEGLPLVLVEAMSMDVPVITTNVGAVNEAIIHGHNGYIVDPNTNVVEDFTSILAKLLTDQTLYHSIQHACRKSVEHQFSIETMTEEYGKTLKSLLN